MVKGMVQSLSEIQQKEKLHLNKKVKNRDIIIVLFNAGAEFLFPAVQNIKIWLESWTKSYKKSKVGLLICAQALNFKLSAVFVKIILKAILFYSNITVSAEAGSGADPKDLLQPKRLVPQH